MTTLTFRTVTYCTDPRCVSVQRCQRAENEDFGNAPGENYGPRCIPAPALDLASGAASVYALGVEEGERRSTAAVVAWLDAHLNLEWCDCCGQRGTTISEIANAIERGEHLEKKP